MNFNVLFEINYGGMGVDKVAEYYDRKSKYYDLFNEDTFRRTPTTVDFFEQTFIRLGKIPRRILDVGCGTGRLSIALSKRGYNVTGIDIAEKALDLAKKKARARDLKAVFVKADMRTYKSSTRFDCAIAGDDVISHADSKEEIVGVFKNILGNLNETGVFIFDAANYESKKKSKPVEHWRFARGRIRMLAERRSHFDSKGVYRWKDILSIDDSGKRIGMVVRNSIMVLKTTEWINLLEKAGFKKVYYRPALMEKGMPRIAYYVSTK